MNQYTELIGKIAQEVFGCGTRRPDRRSTAYGIEISSVDAKTDSVTRLSRVEFRADILLY